MHLVPPRCPFRTGEPEGLPARAQAEPDNSKRKCRNLGGLRGEDRCALPHYPTCARPAVAERDCVRPGVSHVPVHQARAKTTRTAPARVALRQGPGSRRGMPDGQHRERDREPPHQATMDQRPFRERRRRNERSEDDAIPTFEQDRRSRDGDRDQRVSTDRIEPIERRVGATSRSNASRREADRSIAGGNAYPCRRNITTRPSRCVRVLGIATSVVFQLSFSWRVFAAASAITTARSATGEERPGVEPGAVAVPTQTRAA